MKCPFCNYNDTKVIDSRGQEDNSVIRRRRLCESCGKRFTTYERIDMIPITVIKNDGTREIFDKTKIINASVDMWKRLESGSSARFRSWRMILKIR